MVVPKKHTKTVGGTAFSLAAAVEWNKLTNELRENNTLSQLKSDIKTYLLMSALPISMKCLNGDILLLNLCLPDFNIQFSFLNIHHSDWTIYQM